MGTKTESDDETSISCCQKYSSPATHRHRRKKRHAPYSLSKLDIIDVEKGSRKVQMAAGIEEMKSYQHIAGIPQPAIPTRLSAPVHIDIGGTTYTSTLQLLTKYQDSKLAKLFDGTIPVMLDTMKQHYFIDRDGQAFRHILNFLRYNELVLPSNYKELDILLHEAEYYEISPLIEMIKRRRSYKQRGEVELPSQDHLTLLRMATLETDCKK